MLNSNIFVASCSVSLRWLVCGFLAGPPYHTKSKEGLVVSNKDIESDIMDETKSQEIESLKEENLRLRQQMMGMYRAWASGLPLPPFPTFDPANTLSLPPKSQSQFPTVVDAPKHALEPIPRQMHLNTSTSLSLSPQYKSTTFTAPHTVCAFVAQPSTKSSTLSIKFTKGPLNPNFIRGQSSQRGGRKKDNFTPIKESYASLFQRLVQQGMITPILGYTPDLHSRSFDPNVRCAYHSDVQGHSTEDCRTLKRKIEKIIQDKLIVVQNVGPSTILQFFTSMRYCTICGRQ
ncbi:hypothetical protein P3S67_005841 [Capsicum chacoense]